jgi:hypothetical protein
LLGGGGHTGGTGGGGSSISLGGWDTLYTTGYQTGDGQIKIEFLSNLVYMKCSQRMQNITVPEGYNYMYVDMTGAASGGGGVSGTPGYGARVQSYFTVTPGTTVHLNVGCKGNDCGASGSVAGGYNGGGIGYGSGASVSNGGGGGTDIRIGGIQLQHRIMVAGGGGGYYCAGNCGTRKGGDGGKFGTTGSTLTSGGCPKQGLPGGGGADWTTGGSAGASVSTPIATAGSLGKGGSGGYVTSGGGGGGYYGGKELIISIYNVQRNLIFIFLSLFIFCIF